MDEVSCVPGGVDEIIHDQGSAEPMETAEAETIDIARSDQDETSVITEPELMKESEHCEVLETPKIADPNRYAIAPIVVEVPLIKLEFPDFDDSIQSNGRRAMRCAARKAVKNIREAVARRPYGVTAASVASDEDGAPLPSIKGTPKEVSSAEAPPVKRKRGRPRKYPLPGEQEANTPSVSSASTPNVYYVKKSGDIASSPGSSTHRVTILKALDANKSKQQADFGIYEEIGRHVRKAKISSSYTLKKLDDDNVLAKVTEILRPRNDRHSSYDVVTALLRLGVLCVDDPLISRSSTSNGDRMKDILDQLQMSSPGPSGVTDTTSSTNNDVSVLGDSSAHNDSDAGQTEIKYNSVLKSIVTSRRGNGTYAAMNEAVWKFFVGCREANLKLNGKILRQRASSIGARLGLTTFRSSEGWLSGFKQRHHIDFNTMAGVPFDYRNGFVDSDFDSVENSGSREPTVREVVTNSSYLSGAASLISPTSGAVLNEGEGSTISAIQYVEQLSKSPSLAKVDEAKEKESANVIEPEQTQERRDEHPRLIPEVRAAEDSPTVSNSVNPLPEAIESIVRSCVYTVPNREVQAAISTLRSFLMTSNNLRLLKPLVEIQEGLARSCPELQLPTIKSPTTRTYTSMLPPPITTTSTSRTSPATQNIASSLAAQLQKANNGNSTRVYKRVIPRTHLKYSEGRPPAEVQFPKKRYITDPYRDPPTE